MPAHRERPENTPPENTSPEDASRDESPRAGEPENTSPEHRPPAGSVAEEAPQPEQERAGSAFPRALAILVGLAMGVVLLNQFKEFQSLAGPIFLAINLVLAVWPLQSWLVRHRLPQGLAAVISGLLVFVILFTFTWSIGWSIAQMIAELPQYGDQFTSFYNQAMALLASMGITQNQLLQALKGIDPQSFVSVLSGVLTNLQGLFSVTVVVVTAVFFLLMDSIGFPARMRQAGRYRPRIAEALTAFGAGVRRYWIVTTIFGAIVAVLDWLALLLLGVPLAAVWAVLSFVTNYIPNIGFVIGLIPPALMALLAGSPTTALLVVVIYCVLNFIIQSIIQPKFTGDAVGVTPTVTFISLLVWAAILGPLGALLALPATLLVKAILVDADPRARWVNALIASNPKTAGAPNPVASHEQDTDDG